MQNCRTHSILLSVRIFFVTTLLLSIPVTTLAQNALDDSQANDKLSPAGVLSRLKPLADKAHAEGNFDEEIAYRQQYSQKAWATIALDPKLLGRLNSNFYRYDFIFFNDLPLGSLLEGTHKWSEAEAIFRHNQSELTVNRLAGNDIKSENQLLLAHLLASEGKTRKRQIFALIGSIG